MTDKGADAGGCAGEGGTDAMAAAAAGVTGADTTAATGVAVVAGGAGDGTVAGEDTEADGVAVVDDAARGGNALVEVLSVGGTAAEADAVSIQKQNIDVCKLKRHSNSKARHNCPALLYTSGRRLLCGLSFLWLHYQNQKKSLIR